LIFSPYITGTAQPKLNQAKLNQIPIPIPGIEGQKSIQKHFVEQADKIKNLSGKKFKFKINNLAGEESKCFTEADF
jgi:restriction endonuclease S subunit